MKKKLNLKDLEVKSFVTSLDGENGQTVKGGSHITGCGVCETDVNASLCETSPEACATQDYRCQYTRNYKGCSWWICKEEAAPHHY